MPLIHAARAFFIKSSVIATGIWAALVMCFTVGCASGGFKITTEYAGFVNRQHIVIRCILYILTFVVFAVTMILDLVIFNTMDFWEGRVSQGTYNFNKDGLLYAVHHFYNEDGLRESHIQIAGKGLAKPQDIILRETAQAEIEVVVDGALKAKVSNIKEAFPQLSLYNAKGVKTETKSLWVEQQVAVR